MPSKSTVQSPPSSQYINRENFFQNPEVERPDEFLRSPLPERIEASYLNNVEIVKQDFEAEDENLRQWRINLRLIRLRFTSES